MAQTPLPPDSIRAVADAVFSQPDYDRSVRATLWGEFWKLMGRLFDYAATAFRDAPLLGWTALAILLLLVAVSVIRHRYSRLAPRARISTPGKSPGGSDDPWALAHELAGAGRYIEAAHLLYLSILETLAARHRIRLHPAKTAGDYVRDLRVIAPATIPSFREFVRGYEPVVWGSGKCDRETFERLSLAAGRYVAT